VEVTGGPKLLRYIKGGRCDASEPDQVSILPVPAVGLYTFNQSVDP
jgi:hypothetical protein